MGPRRYKHVTSPAVTAVANGGDKRQSAAVQSGSVASGIFQGALETEEGENKAGPIRPAGPLQGAPQSIDSHFCFSRGFKSTHLWYRYLCVILKLKVLIRLLDPSKSNIVLVLKCT